MNWQNWNTLFYLKDRIKRVGRFLNEEDNLYVGTSTIPGAGNGLFTKKGFKKNEIITWYDGKIERYTDKIASDDKSHSITLTWQDLVISGYKDPIIGYGAGSFINDAKNTDDTNAEYKKIDIPEWGSQPMIIVKAIKDIPPNSEIFMRYGKTYWKREETAGNKFFSFFC